MRASFQWFAALTLTCAVGCDEMTSDRCTGPAGDDGGIVFSPIDGFPAQGQQLERVVNAPVTTCRTDDIAATVEVLGPGNRPGSGTASKVTVNRSTNVASTRVTFTPEVAGRWTLVVSFDGLGARSVEVDVLPSYSIVDASVLTVPPSVECPRGPWVMADQSHVFCEQPDASIAMFTREENATVSVFGGMHLVVVEDVVWMLTADGTQLQRHQWLDGGLELTNRWDNFTNSRIRGEHTRTLAVRAQPGFAVRAVDADGGVDQAQRFSTGAFTENFFSYEVDSQNAVEADFINTSTGVVALEPRAKWQASSFPQPGSSMMFRRPINRVVPGGIRVDTPGVVRVHPVEPMERAPMWVTNDAGTLYFRVSPGGLSVSLWPNVPLVRATDDFLILAQADGGAPYWLVPLDR